MKVLLTADQLGRRVPGGIGTYIRGLQRGLRGIGVDVHAWDGRLPPALQVRLWDRGLSKPPKGHRVVHATSVAHPPKRSGSRLSVMVHDMGWRDLPDAYTSRGRRWHEAAVRRALDTADALFTPSAAVAAQLSEKRPGDVHVVPLGCDIAVEPDEAAATARLHSLRIDGPFVLTVGTLEPRKNLPRLFEAFRQAELGMPMVVVGAIGWGERVQPVEGVHLLQGVEDAELLALYRRCHLLAYVPLLEGWGLPVVEAMAMGAPVVSSDIPSAGGATLLVDPTDVSSIASGLSQLSTDDALRASLQQLGNARSATLTWRASAQAHQDVWAQW